MVSAPEEPLTLDGVVARFERGAPDTTALIADGRRPLTYERLARLTSRVACSLREVGIRREDPVAIVLPNGPEMAVAFLGVTCAAVCAPLNPGYKASELEFYFADLGVKALVTVDGAGAAIETAAKLRVPVLLAEIDPSGEAGAFSLSGTSPGAGADFDRPKPDDIALVLHTSGTTARPKIVPLTHRNLCRSAHNIADTLSLSAEDRCLNVMPLFHIHGLIAAVLSSLASGASIVCTPGFFAPDFFSWVERFQPTWYTAVPTMHQAVLSRADENREILAGSPLRFIRSSSAALPPAVMESLEGAFGVPVIESYGMTEAAHQMASNPLPPAQRKPGSVGTAAGPRIAVMDEAGSLVPSGHTGEIVIQGESVTAGYANRPEANRESFQNGWFRTGDQGHLDEDSYLFVTGRLKEIINRGGEKISPREIDECLLRHPFVAQAVAFAVPHAQLGEEVGAAVVVRPGKTTSAAELREFVSEQLSDFKVPRVVEILDEIPKGPTGKTQRIGLAEKLGIKQFDESDVGRKASYQPPATPTQKRLAEIWAEILNVERVGIEDDFFFLGGDSVVATRLMASIADQFEVQISFVRFFDGPTIANLAAQIENAAKQDSARQPGTLIPIQSAGDKTPLFCVGGHDGNLVLFCQCAIRLDQDRPIYGFRLPEFDQRQPAFSLEKLAGDYVRQMRDQQPEGPYLLVGNCFGGVVAYEMARQLEAQNQPVALLAMVNSFPIRGSSSLATEAGIAPRLRFFRRRVALHWNELAGKSIREKFSHLYQRSVAALTYHRFCTRLALFGRLVRGHRRLPAFLRDVELANSHALEQYDFQPFAGSGVLFNVSYLHPEAPEFGWSGLFEGELELVECPFSPRVGQDAEAIELISSGINARLRKVG